MADRFAHNRLKGARFAGMYRLRIGDYRLFYRIDWRDETIIVLTIKHRREAYR